MKRDVKLFFKKAIVIFGLLAVVDIAAGKLLNYFYGKLRNGESAQTNYAIVKATEDCIVLGSSRAVHHYLPSIISDSLQIECYNAGKDGQSILYQYAVMKSILSRKTPKLLLLDVDADEFKKTEVSYGRLSALLPYYYSNKEVQPIILERGPYEKIKACSALYRYNSLVLAAFSGMFDKEYEDTLKGFVPLNKKWNLPLSAPLPEKELVLDSVKINYFQRLLQEAKTAGVKVIMVVSPVFEKAGRKSLSLEKAIEFCKRIQVPVINFRSNAGFLATPAYFSDTEHLNKHGAEQYSKLICTLIKNNGWSR